MVDSNPVKSMPSSSSLGESSVAGSSAVTPETRLTKQARDLNLDLSKLTETERKLAERAVEVTTRAQLAEDERSTALKAMDKLLADRGLQLQDLQAQIETADSQWQEIRARTVRDECKIYELSSQLEQQRFVQEELRNQLAQRDKQVSSLLQELQTAMEGWDDIGKNVKRQAGELLQMREKLAEERNRRLAVEAYLMEAKSSDFQDRHLRQMRSPEDTHPLGVGASGRRPDVGAGSEAIASGGKGPSAATEASAGRHHSEDAAVASNGTRA
eukprot:TRINITY_DN125144_c0_g1_i1.p1 TRINITY_DN125144_c0_g1~~TRINITY_DN125144_c0_g1_i1.p1  ORF type:complete len:271 (-),score=77.09 TRINITY_DN125144_c0_g1_i1:103-915(-)